MRLIYLLLWFFFFQIITLDWIIAQDNDEYTYEELCNFANSSSDADKIIFYSEQAIKIGEKQNINHTKAITLCGLGNLQKGKLSLALEYFFKAANLYEEDNNQIGLASIYDYIAIIYNRQNNYTISNHYNKLAIEIIKYVNDSARLADALHNLGFNYYLQSKYDSALFILKEAKNIYEKTGNKKGVAYCIGNSGLAYSNRNDLKNAESFLKESISLLKVTKDYYAISDFMLEYANILRKKHQIDSAIHCGLNCYNISVENNIAERIRDASKCLADFYSEKELYDSAYFYHVIYADYSDSLKNIETVQKMADQRTTYEVSQKQAEVDLLERQKILYYIVIGSLFLTILFGAWLIVLYYRNLKRVKVFSETLKTQSNQLKQSNAIKDKFFSIISHDLRSPISSLAAISMMIDESLEQDNKSILREASDYIDKTVYSLSGLLDNLLNWAISQQGQFPFNPERIDTKKLINEEVRLLTTIAISKDIKLLLDMRESLYIVADPNSFKTIIRNLLSNAYKFTEKKGEVIVRSNFNADNQVIIEITDNGIGISQDKLDDLFKLKADKSTRGTEMEKGLGLGLNLSYEFVLKNNGQIAVQSQEGKGTTFTLTFPIAEVKEEED